MFKKRDLIRFISFFCALLAVLLIWGFRQSARASEQQRLNVLAREEAVLQLCEAFDSMETSLSKCRFANSSAMLSSVSTDLLRQTASAKACLSSLDAGDTQLTNIYRFLSQTGNFTSSLATRLAAGETLTEEDRETVRQLENYAGTLKKKFQYIQALSEAGSFSFEQVKRTLASDAGVETDYLSAAADAEDSLSDYPTLIYDGPYSDDILEKKSSFTELLSDVTRETAMGYVQQLLRANTDNIVFAGETGGKIPTWNFIYGGQTVCVTKKGGLLCTLINDDFAGVQQISEEEAIKAASSFLERAGYKEMHETYYTCNDGICTVNFAYVQEKYICYPDLIKVSISLSDGTVLGADARAYLMNHTQRDVPVPTLRPADAAQKLNPELRIRQIRMAIIPTDSASEKFAYEFLCENEDGDALVYIDTQTGEEDDILLLLYGDGGTVTK